jgi:hypothetical protein
MKLFIIAGDMVMSIFANLEKMRAENKWGLAPFILGKSNVF